MDESNLLEATRLVLASAFGVSLLLGALSQRTRFCTMGAISDVYVMGDWRRAAMWMLAIVTAMLGFNGLALLGLIRPADTVYGGPRLMGLSAAVGGLLFGFGMVLSSGCVSRNLVRLGAGNLKSLVVLVVTAVAAGATLRGVTAVPRVSVLETVAWTLPQGQTLPELLQHAVGGGQLLWVMLLLLGFAGVSAWGLRRCAGDRAAEVWLAGLGVGLGVTVLWFVSGHLGYLAEDPRTLEPAYLGTASHRMESLSNVGPLAHTLNWLLLFSDQSMVLNFGIVNLAGLLVGAALMAWRDGSFRWEGFGGVADLGRHLVGAVCMGVGGVVALGCTIGQGISGVSTLSLGSLLALGAMVAGAVLGLRYQERAL